MTFNLFLCGVGGQGLVLLTSVIGGACAKSGLKAVTGEMYGLSQRSGSVFVHMRIGEDAFSPLIPYGSADVLLSLEAIEALAGRRGARTPAARIAPTKGGAA